MSDKLGQYELGDFIGRGAMGSVCKGTGPDGRTVAIKTLYPHLAAEVEYAKRFVREAELARKLSHPNVVKVLDVGEDAGQHYIVMEYVDGQPLDEVMKARGMDSVALKRSSKLETGNLGEEKRGKLETWKAGERARNLKLETWGRRREGNWKLETWKAGERARNLKLETWGRRREGRERLSARKKRFGSCGRLQGCCRLLAITG